LLIELYQVEERPIPGVSAQGSLSEETLIPPPGGRTPDTWRFCSPQAYTRREGHCKRQKSGNYLGSTEGLAGWFDAGAGGV